MWFILPTLGTSDELQIDCYGKENGQQTRQIDRNGETNIPKLGRWYLRN
jgi:hypothetical protein